jgi:hypothetical protein
LFYKKENNYMDYRIITGQICPYCNCETELVKAPDIYGPDTKIRGMFYRCVKNHDHYVGTYHFNFNRSLGRVADKELRKWKMKGHDAFDLLWKGESRKFNSRPEAYKWLAEKMGLEIEYTHFGMFDIDQCRKAINYCEKLSSGEDTVQKEQQVKKNNKNIKWLKKLFKKREPDPLRKYRRVIRWCGYSKDGDNQFSKSTRMGQNTIYLSSDQVMLKVYANGYGEAEYLRAPFDKMALKKFIKQNEY